MRSPGSFRIRRQDRENAGRKVCRGTEVAEALFPGGIQHIEQHGKMLSKVTAILFGLIGKVIGKLIPFKNAGIFGKKAKQQPHQVHFERMA